MSSPCTRPRLPLYFLLIFWQSYVDPQSTGLNFVFSDAAKTYSLTYWLGYFVTDEPPPRGGHVRRWWKPRGYVISDIDNDVTIAIATPHPGGE